MVEHTTGTKVLVNCGHSRSNRSQDIRLPHFVTNDDDTDDKRTTPAYVGHHITAKRLSVPGQMAKWAKCAQPSNWWALAFSPKMAYGQNAANPAIVGIIV